MQEQQPLAANLLGLQPRVHHAQREQLAQASRDELLNEVVDLEDEISGHISCLLISFQYCTILMPRTMNITA